MVHVSESVGSAINGSMKALAGSGMASMSEASMDFQPRMLDPSKPRPSAKESSANSPMGMVKCCQVPKVSTNLMSTIFAPPFLAISITCLGVLMGRFCSALLFIWFLRTKIPVAMIAGGGENLLDSLLSGFLSADPDGILDGTDEDLSVADLAGLCGFDDGLNGVGNLAVSQNDLDFYFRKKINGVLAAAINLGVTLLTTKPFDFADRHSLHADAGRSEERRVG